MKILLKQKIKQIIQTAYTVKVNAFWEEVLKLLTAGFTIHDFTFWFQTQLGKRAFSLRREPWVIVWSILCMFNFFFCIGGILAKLSVLKRRRSCCFQTTNMAPSSFAFPKVIGMITLYLLIRRLFEDGSTFPILFVNCIVLKVRYGDTVQHYRISRTL